MRTFSKLTIAALCCAGLSGPALAAADAANGQPTPMQNAPNATDKTAAMHGVSQRLQNDLAHAGFTNITVMPESFLVRAKDSQGNPVMMVINPDSIAEITEQNVGSTSANAAHHTPTTAPSGSSSSTTNGSSGQGTHNP